MRITMMMDADAVQFNLHPESEHEKQFMAGLTKYNGGVSVHPGVNIRECQGGYWREFGSEREDVTAIVIRRELPAPPGGGKEE